MIPKSLINEITLTKESKNTENARYFGAFDNKDRLTFTLTLPREVGCSSPVMEIYRDDDGARFSLDFVWQGSSCGDPRLEEYTLEFDTAELCRAEGAEYESGLFYYSVVFDTAFARHRISRRSDSYRPFIKYADEQYSAFQLTVYEEVRKAPSKFAGGIMYHVFVDRFCKAGDYPVREDAILNPDWEKGIPQFAKVRGGFVSNNMFFGGSLTGVEQKLDYIASLGVSIIYLSPIFEAYSNHKYDTGRYDKVDGMFGGDEALLSLIEKARQKNISVILDMVFNHTGSDSMYFNKEGRYETLGAYQSPESPYYGWYDFEKYPDEYRCWWGIKILPAVNTSNASYNEYMNGSGGIAEKYMKAGVAGYRLDVADELSPLFLENLVDAAKRTNEDALIIGEVWEDASCKEAYGVRRRYFRGRQLDSVMNYPLRRGIIEFVKNKDKKALFEASVDLYENYPKFVSDNLMNFLGTHDTERVLTVFGTDGEEGMTVDEMSVYRMTESQRESATEMLMSAYVILAFMPGIPCIYYGDEAGMEGFRDPFNRMPYVWGREDGALVEHYKNIGRIRRSHKVFSNGYFEVLEDTPDGVFVFRRYDQSTEVFVAVNRSDEDYVINVKGTSLIDKKRRESFIVRARGYEIVRTKGRALRKY